MLRLTPLSERGFIKSFLKEGGSQNETEGVKLILI